MPDATLAILAGGEGSRMGKPKGLLTIGRLPILDFLLDRFNWTGPTMLVTAPGREHPPGWNRFNKETVDPVSGLGPLRGILTALEQAETEIVVFATIDMPGVTSLQLLWLLDQLNANSKTMGTMTERENVIEPFPSAFRTSAAATLRSRLENGLRSVHSLKNEIGFSVIPASNDWPSSIWTNLNNPEEYERFLSNCD